MTKKNKKWVWYVVFFAVILALGFMLFKAGFQGLTTSAVYGPP